MGPVILQKCQFRKLIQNFFNLECQHIISSLKVQPLNKKQCLIVLSDSPLAPTILVVSCPTHAKTLEVVGIVRTLCYISNTKLMF